MLSIPTASGVDSPFRLSSLPQDAFAHAAWTRAERTALESVERRQRLLLLGQPGTGKTLLLRRLGRTLRDRGFNVRELRSGDTLDDLSDDDVLLIDEASLLKPAEFQSMIRLPNALVMAGLPSLAERLRVWPHGVARVTLEPLAPEDVARYVLSRLAASGRPRGSFTPEALVALARESGGLLRLVIILAGAAMFFAERRGAASVAASDVVEAASMRVGAAPAEEIPPPDTARERAPPEAEPAWLHTVAQGRRRRWGRPATVAGLAGWVGASLAVIAVAAVAARAIAPFPLMAVQEIQGRSTPELAKAARPDLATSPAIQPDPAPPVQMASALPPARVAAATPPAAQPASLPETGRPEAMSPAMNPAANPAVPPAIPASRSAPPDPVEPTSTVLAFFGPILNDTMGQGGRLSLQLHLTGAHGPVAAVFHASNGLIGSGVLKGEIMTDGRVTLSGRLMMGRNPFDCALQATLKGGLLVGAATFVRSTSGAAAHSSFALTKL